MSKHSEEKHVEPIWHHFVSFCVNGVSCYSPFLCNYLGWQRPIVGSSMIQEEDIQHAKSSVLFPPDLWSKANRTERERERKTKKKSRRWDASRLFMINYLLFSVRIFNNRFFYEMNACMAGLNQDWKWGVKHLFLQVNSSAARLRSGDEMLLWWFNCPLYS